MTPLTVSSGFNFNRLGTCSSSNSLISDALQYLTSHIKHPYRLLAAHTREIIQKLVQIVPSRQIVKQVFERHTGPHENRRAAHETFLL